MMTSIQEDGHKTLGNESPFIKCHGANCPLKNSCKRHTCQDQTVKVYFFSTPYDVDSKGCESFIDNNID